MFTRDLGHVVYSVGMTADFRSRPLDTIEAHVCLLKRVLDGATFDSLLYLSSTRIYESASGTREQDPVPVNPVNPEHIFNASKLAGEAMCLACGHEGIQVARPSNVVGHDMSPSFLQSVISDAVHEGKVLLRTQLASSKDYILIGDLVWLIEAITLRGHSRIYNAASGANTTHREIIRVLQEETKCDVEVSDDAKLSVFPAIDISLAKAELGFHPQIMLAHLPKIIRRVDKIAET